MSLSHIYENNQWKNTQMPNQTFQNSLEYVLIIDPQSMKYADADESALDSLGYTKEELLDLSPADIDATYDDHTIGAAFEAIMNSKEQHATFPAIHKRKDRSTFEVEVYLRCLEENGRFYILCSATKTSVLKKAQDELKFHSILFNNISDAIFSTDENFTITSWNNYAEEIFGWSAKEAIGQPIHTLTTMVYSGITADEAVQLLFKDGCWKGEVLTKRKDYTTFYALVSTGVLKDNDGKITGTVSVVQDISQRKKTG